MAELSVQPKKKPMWPWVLLIILIILAIVYFIMAYTGNIPPEYNVLGSTDSSMHQTDTLPGYQQTMPADTSHYTDTTGMRDSVM